jgi:peptidoglycan hydrolase-like protein with peptidoglycan-binding domain
MSQSFVLAATALVAMCLVSPAVAAGNFEFVVPGEAGLKLKITGYRPDGSEMFAATSDQLEMRDGKGAYIVRIDETMLKDGVARWCAEDETGSWSALKDHAGATMVCDDKPSETRGSYMFKPGTVVTAAAEQPSQAPTVAAMTSAEATTCVQAGLNSLGYDAGPADGHMGKRTFGAAAQFAARQAGAGYPELTDQSGAEWCTRLTASIADGSAAGPADDVARLRFGPDVDSGVIRDVQAGMDDIAAYFTAEFGDALKTPGTIYVSADAKWLTDAYVAHLNVGQGIRAGKMQHFSGCHGGEAGYGFMFMCSKSDVFDGDWFGSGRQAQRTFAMAHEYFHMLQYERAVGSLENCCSGINTLKMLGPQWLVEGAAEYVAFRLLGDSKRMNFKREIEWHTQKAAEVGSTLEAMQTREGYYAEPRASSAGMIAAHLLAERAGFASLGQFYAEIGSGKDWTTAFEAAFGLSPAGFAEAYEAHIR